MRRILVWTEAELTGLADAWGLTRILSEVDNQGTVIRELGFDAEGRLVHRCPGQPTLTEYGIFDLAKIAPTFEGTEMESDEFDRLWSA